MELVSQMDLGEYKDQLTRRRNDHGFLPPLACHTMPVRTSAMSAVLLSQGSSMTSGSHLAFESKFKLMRLQK